MIRQANARPRVPRASRLARSPDAAERSPADLEKKLDKVGGE